MKPRDVAILFTCVGRRVELIDAFRSAAHRLGIGAEIHGADLGTFAPAMHHVDHAHRVPPIQSDGYINALLDIVRREHIDLVVPTIDPDLLPLAKARESFAHAGATVLVSPPDVIATCRDKLATYNMLASAGIDTPETRPYDPATPPAPDGYPYFLKPREGSAGKGGAPVNDEPELQARAARIQGAIVQELVVGVEHTLDVYCGLDETPRCAVPRRRIEVRAGEVSKAVIVKDPAIIDIGLQVVRNLRRCRGVITVQCIKTPAGRIRVIEINPRFGGGAPLAIHAGADFPQWLLTELLGGPPPSDPMNYEDDLAMLRYDRSVFLSNASQHLPPPNPP